MNYLFIIILILIILIIILIVLKYINNKTLIIKGIEQFIQLEAAPNENEPLYAQYHNLKSDSDTQDSNTKDSNDITVQSSMKLLDIKLPFNKIETESEYNIYNYSKCQQEVIDKLNISDNYISNVSYMKNCTPKIDNYLNNFKKCYTIDYNKKNDSKYYSDCKNNLLNINNTIQTCNKKIKDEGYINNLFDITDKLNKCNSYLSYK
jgi:hypothetical protein